jgi:hypothetical protein
MATYTNTAGTRKATLKYNEDWEEYIVRFYHNGLYQKDADYHTDCRDDAEETANFYCNQEG